MLNAQCSVRSVNHIIQYSMCYVITSYDIIKKTFQPLKTRCLVEMKNYFTIHNNNNNSFI